MYQANPTRVKMDFVYFCCRANLSLVKELGDRAAQGRTCGNLGNTYYLLGNFRSAVTSHQQVGDLSYVGLEFSLTMILTDII